MVNRQDLIVGRGDFQMSLSKLTGKRVVDVTFYISTEVGEYTMKVCDVILEDGTRIDVEGEHDFPYLAAYESQNIPNTDQETLEALYKQDPDYEDDEKEEN